MNVPRPVPRGLIIDQCQWIRIGQLDPENIGNAVVIASGKYKNFLFGI